MLKVPSSQVQVGAGETADVDVIDQSMLDELIADWELAVSGENPYKIDPL